jgi:hypothetical protein
MPFDVLFNLPFLQFGIGSIFIESLCTTSQFDEIFQFILQRFHKY